MDRNARAPLIASVLAHSAFFALCGRVREHRWLDVASATDAIELELVFATSAHREAPRRDEPPPIIVAPPRPQRLSRTLARAAPTPSEASTSDPAAGARSSEPPASPAQPSVTGMNLLRSMSRDAFASERWRFGSAPVEGPLSPEQLAEQRALDRNVGRITDRWREEVLRAAPPPRPPSASEYVRRVATAAARAWAPVRAQDLSIADGLLRLLLAGSEGYRSAQTDSQGMFGAGRGAAGADEVNNAHPNSPMLQRNPTLNEVGRATAQRIAVEIDVRQSADGRLVAISVARSSGSGFFDRQAIDAVRCAIEQSGARAASESTVPTRTRWQFELRVARNPAFALGPQLPDAPTAFNLASGGVEWGGVDPPRAMYPFALHRYQRVRILWVTADSTPSTPAVQRPTRDAGR